MCNLKKEPIDFMCLYNELLVAICFQLFLIRSNCKQSGSHCCETFAPDCESQAISNNLMGALSKYNAQRQTQEVLNNLPSVNIALDFPI